VADSAETIMIGGGRPMRTCIGCGQTDDHPRCIVDKGDEGEVTWHMDCHFIATGPQPCHASVTSADGPTGAERLVAIQEHAAAEQAAANEEV